MARTKNGNIVSIPDNQLPIILSENKTIQDIKKNTKKNSKWNTIKINDTLAYKETDTLDTFMESSWYYVRYTDPHFHGMVNSKLANYWLPVDQYVGGVEHATMHLIYFRFYHKLLRDFGFVNSNEPVKRLLCQGMVLSDAFYLITKNSHKWINPNSIKIERDTNGKIINAVTKDGQKAIYAGMIKMSKSKNNGIEPDAIIKKYGADAIRLFIMFAAPVEMSLEWQESGIKGIYRFLQKLWKLIYYYIKTNHYTVDLNTNLLTEKQKEIRCKLHKTIIKVTDDIDRRQTFNTAISAIMKLVNVLIKKHTENEQDAALMQESLFAITKMLYPFIPHFSFVAWKKLTNNKSTIDNATWPIPDKKAILEEKITIAIQINGKTRCTVLVQKDILKEQVILQAQKNIVIMKYIKNKIINKIIYIPKKILNLVID